MEKAKFYSVRKGNKVGIFKTLTECQDSVKGYSGAEYKSFENLKDSERYLNNEAKSIDKISISEVKKDKMIAYVDGSYDSNIGYYSYGAITFLNGEKKEFSDRGNVTNLLDMRRVAGEILGAKAAMAYALDMKVKKLYLHYDYEGIEKWATSAWEAKKEGTKEYKKYYDTISKDLEVVFIKVRAHSGDKYNEEVDQLAKKALLKESINKEDCNKVELISSKVNSKCNKKVLVTGGSKGIGEAIGKAYKAAGYFVIVADLVECSYADYFYKVDFGESKEIELLMDNIFYKFKDIDILINNVGVGYNTSLLETKTEDFLRVINTNLTSAFITSREFAKNRDKNKDKFGRIISIASTRYLMSEKNTEGYSASKGGIVSITHALAISFSEYNITVNCISPGWIENYNYKDLSEEDHSQHPSGRVGKPEDIAGACLFLSSEDNDFINGQNIIIDGGMTKKMIYV